MPDQRYAAWPHIAEMISHNANTTKLNPSIHNICLRPYRISIAVPNVAAETKANRKHVYNNVDRRG